MTVQFSGIPQFSGAPRMRGVNFGCSPQFSSARFGNSADTVSLKKQKNSGGNFCCLGGCSKIFTVPAGIVLGSMLLSPLPIIGPITGGIIGGVAAAIFL